MSPCRPVYTYVYVLENMCKESKSVGYTYKCTELDTVPDKRSRDLEVVVVRRIINLGTGNLEWGGNGKGLRKGRSVYE
jgi:hypothetical protein